MHITINGHTKDVTAGTIADIVGQFCKTGKHIITEINGHIVPSGDWGTTSLKEGDTVELVAFVGGG